MLFNRFTKDQINDSFKPCYKWITFNTWEIDGVIELPADLVLNLVINGLPSILLMGMDYDTWSEKF